ncbi:MAG: PaaI family thioesterase, partial [Actinomycetes bacterium]
MADDRPAAPTPEDPTAFIRATMPLCATLGIRAEAFERSRVVLALDWAAELCTTAGVLHGGVLMAVADSAGGACA